jgi:hypothetical protein
MRDINEIRNAAEKVSTSLARDLQEMEVQILKDDFGKPTNLWKSAFDEYNSHQIKNGGRKLSMSCRSCWFKVLKFHENKGNA